MLIRKTQKTDLAVIYNFICSLENERLDESRFQTIFESNIQNNDYLYLVAEQEGNILAFISFHVQNLLHHAGKVGEIQEFYVEKDHRGKGIGRLLWQEIRAFAEANQLKSIEVTTNKKRLKNIAIYKNLGFVLSHHKFTISHP